MMEVSHRQRFVGALIALGAVLATIFVISRLEAEPAPSNLIGPEHIPAGSELVSEGAVDPQSASHPLSLAGLEGQPRPHAEAVYAYEAVEEYIAFTPDRTMVMNYRYDYEEPSAADEAADLLAQTLRDQTSCVEGSSPMSAVVDGAHRSACAIEGEEGTALHWYIATRGPYLHLLIVEGLTEGAVATTRDAVMNAWLSGGE